MDELFYYHEPSDDSDYYEVVTKNNCRSINSLLELAKKLIEYYELKTLPEEAEFYQERQILPQEFDNMTTVLSFTIPKEGEDS